VSAYGQGVLEYSIYNDNLDQTYFIISDASQSNSEKVEIFLSINGKSPKPESEILVNVGPHQVHFVADSGGSISTACHACAANFDVLWGLIRSGAKMTVSFGGQIANFSLKGSAKVLDKSPPVADFYR